MLTLGVLYLIERNKHKKYSNYCWEELFSD